MKAFLVEQPRTGALRALNYSPAIERIRRSGSSSAVPLSKIFKNTKSLYGNRIVNIDCDPEFGVEVLDQSGTFKTEPTGRFIRPDCFQTPDRHLIRRNEILIAGAGTLGENELYGRAIIADDRLAGKYVGPDTVKLEFIDPDDDFSLFAYAWLACPTGVQAIRSTSYGTKILRFRSELFSSLPVPAAPPSVVSRVATLVRECSCGREQFLELLGRAKELVNALPDMQTAHELCAERQKRSVIWDGPLPSFCAWNFAAGGGAVSFLRNRWSATLGDITECEGVFNGPRFVRINCSPPHGIDFLSQRDVFLMRPVGRRIARPLISDRLLFVPKDALLVGSHGQMTDGSIFGKVEMASFAGWRSGVTQDILRVLVHDGFRELAYAFLSTTVGHWLLKSTAVGTSIPSMRIDLLERLPFPDEGALQINEIRALVLASEKARFASEGAEAEAIRIIEEEVLPQWLA